MKAIERLCWAFYLVVTLDLARGLLKWAIDLAGYGSLTASDWASWVQAVGSVCAIFSAIWLASREDRRRRKEAIALAMVSLASLLPKIKRVGDAIDGFIQELDREGDVGILADYPLWPEKLRAAGKWHKEDYLPLVVLPRNVAAHLALFDTEYEIVFTMLKHGFGEGTGNLEPEERSALRDLLLPRLRGNKESLDIIRDDCEAFLFKRTTMRS